MIEVVLLSGWLHVKGAHTKLRERERERERERKRERERDVIHWRSIGRVDIAVLQAIRRTLNQDSFSNGKPLPDLSLILKNLISFAKSTATWSPIQDQTFWLRSFNGFISRSLFSFEVFFFSNIFRSCMVSGISMPRVSGMKNRTNTPSSVARTPNPMKTMVSDVAWAYQTDMRYIDVWFNQLDQFQWKTYEFFGEGSQNGTDSGESSTSADGSLANDRGKDFFGQQAHNYVATSDECLAQESKTHSNGDQARILDPNETKTGDASGKDLHW